MDFLSIMQAEERQQQELKSQQDRTVANGIISRLEDYKTDPQRYNDFKTRFIDSNPEIKGTLERVYTPKGLAAMLDTSMMETPEQKNIRKSQEIINTRRTQAVADSDVFVLTKEAEAKKFRQQKDLETELDPKFVEARARVAENAAVAEGRGTYAREASSSIEKLRALNKQRSQIENVEKLKSSYDVALGIAETFPGMEDDPTTQNLAISALDSGGPATGVNSGVIQKTVDLYQNSAIAPGKIFTYKFEGEELNHDEGKVKEFERAVYHSLTTGKDANGKKLDSQELAGLEATLYNSPLMDGRPSPYWMLAKANEAKKRKEQKKLSGQKSLQVKAGN